MTNRQETHEIVRLCLGNCIQTLAGVQDPCGPNECDLNIIVEMSTIMHKLGAEERASIQLNVADEALGWHGTGLGRIERIKQLRKLEK